jgi:predicted flap endonuclease-1-like 5' DNA nuclease
VDLVMKIFLFLIASAAIGFAIGWMLRAARVEAATTAAPAWHGDDLAAVAQERDRLRADLESARERARALEQAEADHRERIAGLENELSRARTLGAEARAGGSRGGSAAASAEYAEGKPPEALTAPEGQADDLKRISGIGPGIERTLNHLGVFHFRQIAAWTPENVAWVDRHLRFKGRVEREGWIEQARKLEAGEPL